MSDTPFAGQLAREPALRLRDNPILVAQATRRLRVKQVVPTLLIAGLIGLCGVFFVMLGSHSQSEWGTLSFVMVGFMGFLLHLRGTTQVAGTLTEERRSGILDFHRATPTTLWTDVLGYLLGCPAREYAAAAVFLPFFFIAGLLSGVFPLNLVMVVGIMVLTGWLYHALGMVVGLTINSKRGTTGSALVGIVLLLLFAWLLHKTGFVTLTYLTAFPAVLRLLHTSGQLEEMAESVSFYGLVLHPVVFTLLVQGTFLLFLLWASARKIHREGTPGFSRPGACALFMVVVFLSFGGSWRFITGTGHLPDSLKDLASVSNIVGQYVLVAVALASFLLVSLAPSYLEFVRALRRARRRGQDEAPWLADGAALWPLIPAFSLLVFAGLAFLALGLGTSSRIPASALQKKDNLLCLAAVVAFLALAAGATEYVNLYLRKSARSGAILIVFLTLILPWMVAAILGSALSNHTAALYASALSPAFAVGGSAAAMAAAWAGEVPKDYPPGAVGFSVGVTLCMAGWFLYRAHTLQAGLAEKIPKRQA